MPAGTPGLHKGPIVSPPCTHAGYVLELTWHLLAAPLNCMQESLSCKFSNVFATLFPLQSWSRRWDVVDSFGRSADQQTAAQTLSRVWSSVMSFCLIYVLFPRFYPRQNRWRLVPIGRFFNFIKMRITSKSATVYLNHLGPSSFIQHDLSVYPKQCSNVILPLADNRFWWMHAVTVWNLSKWLHS